MNDFEIIEKITKKVEVALQREIENQESDQSKLFYKCLLTLVCYSRELILSMRYGKDKGMQNVYFALKRILISVYITISFLKYEENSDEERTLERKVVAIKQIQKNSLLKKKKIYEKRIGYINNFGHTSSEWKELENKLKEGIKEIDEELEEGNYDVKEVDEFPMIRKLFEVGNRGEITRQSLYGMFQNCHPYVHASPCMLNTIDPNDIKEQKLSYIHIQAMLLRRFDDYITDENDKVFLNNILNSDKISD